MPGEGGARLGVVDRIYGAIAVVAVVLAVWYLVAGARGGGADGTAPRLVIESPAAGTTVAQPVTLVFQGGPGLGPDGTDAARLRHVHADVGGMMVMPVPGAVQPLGKGRYRWRLPRLAAGETVLRLYWSDATHRALATAPADSVRIRLGP
jgi:hypothetical protein